MNPSKGPVHSLGNYTMARDYRESNLRHFIAAGRRAGVPCLR